MKQVKVSVITIVKNGYDDITYTMESVLKQSFFDFEYIIKDGGSSDGTVDLINKLIEKYPDRDISLISSLDKGIYDAMNQAVHYCHGQWVIFINCGDAFLNINLLEEVFREKDNFVNYGVVYGDAVVRDECEDMIWEADISLIQKKMPFSHQCCFIKRDLLLEYPFDIKFKIAADYNNILDLYSHNIQFYYFKGVISIFKINGISSQEFLKRYKEKLKIISAHGYKYNNFISICGEMVIQSIKTIVIRTLPPQILNRLKRYYKIHIKEYTTFQEYKK